MGGGRTKGKEVPRGKPQHTPANGQALLSNCPLPGGPAQRPPSPTPATLAAGRGSQRGPPTLPGTARRLVDPPGSRRYRLLIPPLPQRKLRIRVITQLISENLRQKAPNRAQARAQTVWPPRPGRRRGPHLPGSKGKELLRIPPARQVQNQVLDVPDTSPSTTWE